MKEYTRHFNQNQEEMEPWEAQSKSTKSASGLREGGKGRGTGVEA